MVQTLEGKDVYQTINHLLANIHSCEIDERLFSFIFRRFRPLMQQVLHATPKQRLLFDLKIFKSFAKILQSSDLNYERFLEYLTEQDITTLFETHRECPEKSKEYLMCLIDCILTKFRESSKLFKEIIANYLLMFQNTLRFPADLCDDFRILHQIISTDSFGDNLVEYYKQFILPCTLYVPVANFEMAAKLTDLICSRSPECQKIVLRYFSMAFGQMDSLQQVKIVELASRIIHSNFFFQSKSPIEWEFCDILNQALKSENYLVIDSIIEVFSDVAVKKYITDGFSTILPKIFENLYKLSKKFWRHEQRYKTIQTIGNILKINPDVFEECLVKYNKKRYYRSSQDPSLDNEKFCFDQIKKIQHSFD